MPHTTPTSTERVRPVPLNDPDYQHLTGEIDGALAEVPVGESLFTTDAEGLFDTFLAKLPKAARPRYVCSACRRFVEAYGGLVRIDAFGLTTPVFWQFVGAGIYAKAVAAVHAKVAQADVTGVFVSSEPRWGLPRTGEWTHMAVARVPAGLVFKASPLKTAGQRAAELLEEHGMLTRGLDEFPSELVDRAHAMLTNGQLFRSEKCVGVADWLRGVHAARAVALRAKAEEKDRARCATNILWRAVAAAPVGFCHVKATMIGTLLEDLRDGMDLDTVKRRFDVKMNPLIYQRPQAAPSAGNLRQAEKAVEALGSRGAFARRYATLQDLAMTTWLPPAAKSGAPLPAGALFGGIQPKRGQAAPAMVMPTSRTFTYEKFRREVLPQAKAIRLVAPPSGNFGGILTAVDPTAPPILQWDREDHRNPCSSYVYVNGSSAHAWSLRPSGLYNVLAITPKPACWNGPPRNDTEAALFVLEGARDASPALPLCLFPEILRSEYHGIRSSIEALSTQSRTVRAPTDVQEAAGLFVGQSAGATLRVTTHDDVELSIVIDRWD